MDSETEQLFVALCERLDRERMEIESSLIAHRTVLQELLARHFEGRQEEFNALMDECLSAARGVRTSAPLSEEAREELAATTAARLEELRRRIAGTFRT